MKDTHELNRFFRDNEAYLVDVYKAGKLKRLTYHFYKYLKQRGEDDPEFFVRYSMQLPKQEPDAVDLNLVFNID